MMSKQNESKTPFVLKYALLFVLVLTHYPLWANLTRIIWEKDFVGKQNFTGLNENYKFNLYSIVVSEISWYWTKVSWIFFSQWSLLIQYWWHNFDYYGKFIPMNEACFWIKLALWARTKLKKSILQLTNVLSLIFRSFWSFTINGTRPT